MRRIVRVRRELAAIPPRPAEPRWTARNVAHRLGEAKLARLVREYEAEDGCTVLSRRYNLSENGVLAQLKRAGVAIRPPGKVTADDVGEMRRLRQEGWTYAAIGDRFGITRTAVKLRVDRG